MNTNIKFELYKKVLLSLLLNFDFWNFIYSFVFDHELMTQYFLKNGVLAKV